MGHAICAGDRHVTPWLTIMGKSAPAVPVVEVLLRRAGDEVGGRPGRGAARDGGHVTTAQQPANSLASHDPLAVLG